MALRSLLASGLGIMVALAASAPAAVHAADQDLLKTRVVKRAYADVRIDIQNAIINQGLKIDFNGRLGDMLKRTASDVGAKGDLYVDAEYFTFCSSKLSRGMMDADPVNLGLCPYTMFIYQRAGTTDEVTIGYKGMPMRGDEGSRKSLGEINALLDKILDDASQ